MKVVSKLLRQSNRQLKTSMCCLRNRGSYPNLSLFLFCLFLAACLSNNVQAQVNLALTATASHSGGGSTSYGPANYNDNTIPSCSSGCSSCSTPWGWVNDGTTEWIEYTWPSDQVFDKVVFHKADRVLSQTKLQYWNGAAYVDIVDYNSSVCPLDSIVFPPVTSTRLRFYGMKGGSNPNFREIQVFEKLAPCSGKPVAGTAVAAVSPCPGSLLTLSLSGYMPGFGMTYEWDSSSTGTGGWAALSSASSISSYSYVPPDGKSLYYRCRLICTGSGGKDTSVLVMATGGSALTPPYSETFEGITAKNTFPDCMSATRVAPYVYSYLVPTGSFNQINHTPGGSKFVSFRYGSNDYLFTPALNLEGGKQYRLSFWYITDGKKGWTSLSAKIGTSASAAAMTTTLDTKSSLENETYEQFITDFTVPASGINFIGIHSVATTSPNYLTIDDLNLIELPPCGSGTLTAGSVASATPSIVCSTPGSTLLSLSMLPPFSGLSYQWEQATGTPAVFNPISGATTATYTATVTTNTYFRCKIACSTTGSFVYSDTTKVLTSPFSLPYREDFESGEEGINMPCAGAAGGSTVWSAGSASYWDLRDGPYSSSYPSVTNHTPGGSKYLYSGYYNGPYNGSKDVKDNYFWFTPGLAMSGGKSYKCSFWFSSNGSTSSSSGFKLGIYAGTEQTAAGMVLRAGGIDTNVEIRSGGYRQIVRSFTAPVSGTYYVGIKTVHTGYTFPGVPIDDIGIEQNPSCSGRPVAGVADADPSVICGTETSTVRLSGTSEASDLHYQWLQSTSSSGPWTTVSGGSGATAADYTTPSLSAGSWYRCVVTCTVSGLSDTSSAVLVQANGIVPPYVLRHPTRVTTTLVSRSMISTSTRCRIAVANL